MCGIVGAIAQRDIAAILIEGLKRLEYRGYDSAGMAVIHPKTHEIQRLRVLGKVEKLAMAQQKSPLAGSVGVAHTRWATHGQPTQANAHPHCHDSQLAIVHNGIIENHEALRKKLTVLGYVFQSETDTEVIVHLLHYHLQQTQTLLPAIYQTTAELKGAYALGIIWKDQPEHLYAVRQGSPLVIGLGIGENFIASDQLALLPVTQEFIFLEEGDVAKISLKEIAIHDKNGEVVTRKKQTTEANTQTISKGQYRHFMLKEIYEQPKSLTDTLEGRIISNQLSANIFGHRAEKILKKIKRVQIIACGTSYHAGLVARHWLETLAKTPCQVEIASEHRYRHTIVEPNTLFVALSQSGETADTLAALRQAKEKGFAATLGICNVAESSLVREADLAFLTRAGTEIGVAATKTFTAQLVALFSLTIVLGQCHNFIKNLQSLPNLVKKTLELDDHIQKISHHFIDKQHALFLGRGEHHAIAMEGALKLKEISYMHAEAYAAGELKHGPLALVDENMPVIVVAPNNTLIDKLESNMQEVQARGGELYVLADKSLNWKPKDKLHLIELPEVPDTLTPMVYTIPLQLLSYHIAVLKGTDVDQPRNLAKSVTVE